MIIYFDPLAYYNKWQATRMQSGKRKIRELFFYFKTHIECSTRKYCFSPYFLKPLCQLSFLKSFLNTGSGLSSRSYLCSWGLVSSCKMHLYLIPIGIVRLVLWHALAFSCSYLYCCDLAFAGWQIAIYKWLCACGFVYSNMTTAFYSPLDLYFQNATLER